MLASDVLHFLSMLAVVAAAFAAAFGLLLPGRRAEEAWVARPWMIPLWGFLGEFDVDAFADYLGGQHDPVNEARPSPSAQTQHLHTFTRPARRRHVSTLLHALFLARLHSPAAAAATIAAASLTIRRRWWGRCCCWSTCRWQPSSSSTC